MKKILLILIAFIIFAGKVAAQTVDYDAIYNNLPIIDLVYEQNEDPDEQADTLQFFQSPYPLIRTVFPLSCKKIKLKLGYYLLTPRTRDGFDFVMFKQNGKIVGLVPVFEKRPLTEEEKLRLFPPPPKPKTTIWSLPWRGFKAGMKKMFGRYEKPPEMPKYVLDANIVGNGRYFEMYFYSEQYFFKMLFKIDR